MLMYGTALFNGDGVAQDPVLAYAFVSRAAAQGLAPAKSTLEQMDQVLTVDQRKKGLSIALQKAKSAPKPSRDVVRTPVVKLPAKPKPKPVQVATTIAERPAPAASTGSWRMQLGAFGQRGSAEALFRNLSSAAPVAGHQMILIPAGAVTRLQVGPFESKAAAAAGCRTLASRGQACFVVPAK